MTLNNNSTHMKWFFYIGYFKRYVKSKSDYLELLLSAYLSATFYDLSAFVGCWSSVSIRRIIYNFLNVCPFDYTAVVVSGKIVRT